VTDLIVSSKQEFIGTSLVQLVSVKERMRENGEKKGETKGEGAQRWMNLLPRVVIMMTTKTVMSTRMNTMLVVVVILDFVGPSF